MRLDGADEFARDLDRTISAYPQSVRDAAEAVAQSLATRARVRGQIHGGVARKAADDIRARANTVTAGDRMPYFMGAEYGSIRSKQFDSFRGNAWRGWQGSPGSMIGATVRDDARALMDHFLSRMDAAHRVSFPH